MMLRYGTARRASTVALAIWFVFLSASAHLLHTHPQARGDDDGRPCSRLQNEDAASNPSVVGPDHPADYAGPLCPICVFLAKYTAHAPAVAAGAPPADPATTGAVLGRPDHVLSVEWSAVGARAPPC